MSRFFLTPEERAVLERFRDTAQKPFQRERAAALLKVADGLSVSSLARDGLLRPHTRATLYAWMRRYRSEGIASLSIRPGRGRKPAFSPSLPQ